MPKCLRGKSVSWANWAVLNAPTPIRPFTERLSLMLPEKVPLLWCWKLPSWQWVHWGCMLGSGRSPLAGFSAERLGFINNMFIYAEILNLPFLASKSDAPPDCNASLSWSQLGEGKAAICFFSGGSAADPLDILLVWRWWHLMDNVLASYNKCLVDGRQNICNLQYG